VLSPIKWALYKRGSCREFQRLGAAIGGISIDQAWFVTVAFDRKGTHLHFIPPTTFTQRAKLRRSTASTTTRSG